MELWLQYILYGQSSHSFQLQHALRHKSSSMDEKESEDENWPFWNVSDGTTLAAGEEGQICLQQGASDISTHPCGHFHASVWQRPLFTDSTVDTNVIATASIDVAGHWLRPISLSKPHSISGQIPSEWKEANITPIPKSGGKKDISNFRPISFLPVIAKLMEFFVTRQLREYIQCKLKNTRVKP